MKTGIRLSSTTSIVAVAFATIVLSYSPYSHTCGLEPSVNGGFTISYPGSLDVAVAVANARSIGLLPPVTPNAIPNEVRLQHMLADLRRLQTRLNKGRSKLSDATAEPFSLILVGPGMWSHFYMTAGGVLANYHTDGPLAGKVVVLTHPVVLRAILAGGMSIEQATELGLLTYSGSDITPIQRTLEIGLQAKT